MSTGISEKDFLILILDDDEGNRYVVRRVLEQAGYRTIEAETGHQALEIAKLHDPDLAIVDICLPDMSGYDVGRKIKELSQSLIVPVLHISAAFVGTDSKVKGLDFGADGYLTHPIEPVMVLSTVRSLLRIRKAEKERFVYVERMRKSQKELELAKQSAEEANHAKSRFLANMSHEIRTPLGAILGCADLLSDSIISGEKKEFLDIIRKSGHQLANVIDDILDLSKVEAGHLEVERVPVSISLLLNDINSLFANRASQKQLDFRMETDASVPPIIISDPTRLKQILINLVGNAVKFTTTGSVSLSVQASDNLPNRIHFIVTDTGPGIAEDLWETLFEPFTQADISMTRKFGGTGLGLGLARKLARALGGDVKIETSQRGGGTTIVATIDPGNALELRTLKSVQEAASREGKTAKRKNLDGLRVLLVDDAPENRLIIDRVLRRAGANVDMAENGIEGVSKAMSSPHDVILMDLQMPVLDGMEATKELRKQGYSGAIVALTAHAMKEERTRCLQEGFNDHIPKPINFDQLINVVNQYRLH